MTQPDDPATIPRRHPGPVAVRFLGRALLFLLPVMMPMVLVEVALYRSGETWPVERVLAVQSRRPQTLFLRRIFDQEFYRYKWLGIKRIRPRVLALGSSRVMQLRSQMFSSEHGVFYNSGGVIQNLGDLDAFSRQLPQNLPIEVVLLGVDMWWFNAARLEMSDFDAAIRRDATRAWQQHILGLQTVLRKSFSGAWLRALAKALVQPRPRDRIGLGAVSLNTGFRSDGSMKHGYRVPKSEAGWRFVDREEPPVRERIRRGIKNFELTKGLSKSRLRRFDAAVRRLRARGILVVGYAPPMDSSSVVAMARDPRHRRIWTEFLVEMPKLFARLNLPYFDYSTPQKLGLDDRYMSDGFHGMETIQLHMLRDMSRDPRIHKALPGLQRIADRALGDPATNYFYPRFSKR